MIRPDESEQYLGIRVNPLRGVLTPELQIQYEDWADHGELGVVALRALDGPTRKVVKKWLPLPLCTTDALLFARCKDGGLGLQKLERMVPSIQVRRLHQLLGSPDELVSALICDSPYMITKLQKLWKRAGGSEDSLPPLGVVRAEPNPVNQDNNAF
ncbi:hypothetical protein SRHO_G00344100 [Serrasalmus rhombeus]